MREITCYLDFASPYAWLAFAQLPQALEGLHYHARYRPVLLGALLKHLDNPGPAAIAPKRAWLYRHVSWLGQHLGVELQMPTQHPFSALPLLRLALRCSSATGADAGTINRWVAETVLRHVWQGGHDALDPQRLEQLELTLQPQLRSSPEQAKALLRSNTDAAAAAGVFGVPSFELDGHCFWGLDSLPMLRAYLQDDAWFAQNWQTLARVPQGL